MSEVRIEISRNANECRHCGARHDQPVSRPLDYRRKNSMRIVVLVLAFAVFVGLGILLLKNPVSSPQSSAGPASGQSATPSPSGKAESNSKPKASPATLATTQPELTARQIASLAYTSSVSVYASGDDENSRSGTGFVVAPGTVVTCYHVVKDAESILVTPINENRERYVAKLLRHDHQ